MSILEKSERIGRELKNTIEGQHALELYKMISQYPQETTFEFFQLINRYYIQAHFSLYNMRWTYLRTMWTTKC